MASSFLKRGTAMAEKLSFEQAIVAILNGNIPAGMPWEDVMAELLLMVKIDDPSAVANAWMDFSLDECGMPDYLSVAAQILGKPIRPREAA
jgi:hypothetical protein